MNQCLQPCVYAHAVNPYNVIELLFTVAFIRLLIDIIYDRYP